jgi:hypothetical protein
MLANMRLSCGARAARLPRGACVARIRWVLAVAGWLLTGSSALHAQAAPDKPSSADDVLNAPPPAPELTELDERKPPETSPASEAKPAAPKAPPAAPKPAASKPAASAAPKPAAPKPAAPKPAASAAPKPAAPKPAAPEPTPTAPKPASESTLAPAPAKPAAADPADPAQPPLEEGIAADTPPPPSVDGDFAGSSTPSPAAAAQTQDDFAAEAQEYTKPKKREYSVRIDLLNWLLLGRLSVELEMALWKFISVQLTPVFVLAQSPIAINYAGLDDPLKQYSHGIGPLSGISLGVAAWLWGEPFKGYVLRLELTNYGYSYRTADALGRIDRVDFTERRLILFVGSHSRFGAFTFAGGFGLGLELNQQERCGLMIPDSGDNVGSRSNDCRGRQQIALDREGQERADLNGPLHPVYFQARFSVGVVF